MANPYKPHHADKMRKLCEDCDRTEELLLRPAEAAGLDVSDALSHNARQRAIANGLLGKFFPQHKADTGIG